jgi:hypothetical protein
VDSEDFSLWASGADHRPLSKAQVQKNPVTEPKRSPKSKRPLAPKSPAHRYSFDGNALIF